MSEFFIRRPIFASVISIVIMIAGLVSFGALPVEKFPPISPPTVQVSAVYPGANAETIAETVAAPIEQAVNGVEGMIYMSSTSTAEGTYTLTVTFEMGTDLDIASVLVQNLVGTAEAQLPPEVRQQGVTTKKRSTQVLQFISLTSDREELDGLYLSNFALDVRDELSRVKGVGDSMVFGAGDYSMRIWLDSRKLKQRDLTTNDVLAAIREQNVQVAAGQLGGPPSPDSSPFQLTIRTTGRLIDPEEFANIVLRTDVGGRVLRLGDVARVELGAKSYSLSAYSTGDASALLAIYQLPGANSLETATLIEERLQSLSSAGNWPSGVEYSIVYDTTTFVEASIAEVYTTLLMAVGLVVLVIFVFLQDWRATIIPVVAIPVSLVGTLAVMNGIGFSLNMLSLFGIVLAIGIVVDDAIVVVENTTRHLESGLSGKQAAIKAMSEISGPVVATTLVLLAVFVPCAFMPGITGELFRQFALTISAAVIISTINALTLSPALCGILLRPPKQASFILFRWFNKAFDLATDFYGAIVARVLRVTAVVGLVYFGLIAYTGWSFSNIPTGFVPDEDQGAIMVNVQLPDGASINRADDVVRDLDAIFAEAPGVENWITVSGYSLIGGNQASNVAFAVLVLEPWEDRSSSETQIAAIQKFVTERMKRDPRAVMFTFTPPAIDGLGVAGGFQMELQDRGNSGYEQLQRAANVMVETGNQQPGLAGVNSTFRANTPGLFVEVDRTKAKLLNVPLSEVYATLQASLGSSYVNDFTYNNRTYQVRVQSEAEYRQSLEDISQLDVRDATGNMVPLDSIITIRDDFGPNVVRRYNLYPSAAINGSAAPLVSSGQALALMEDLTADQLPSSFGYEWTGMSYQEKQASGGQLLIFGLSIVFVFLVLAAQYESWTSPAAVIAVVPLAALGVVLALNIRGLDNNTYTQIGVVLLVALASKNAILIVEFASELRRDGKSIQEAALQSAKLRFRAILMTAFSSILGFMPLLIASGAGAASRQAVGTAVVGGMTAAIIFALLMVPTFFQIFQRLSEWNTPAPETPTD